MIFKGILNGCSTNVVNQAEELNGFICEHLNAENIIGSTLLLYSRKEEKDALLRLVPTPSVTLVRVTHYQPENILEAIKTAEHKEMTDLYLFPSGFAGSEIAVRLAFRMDGSSLVQVKEIDCSKEQLIARKTVYANHVLGTFKLEKKPWCVSLARGSTHGRPITLGKTLVVTELDMTRLHKDTFIKVSTWISEKPARDLTNTRFLIIGGQGMDTKENTRKLKQIAESMGADFGVSRPVAMHAWAPMHRMIGVSGAMTKADVCIVAGVSGAPAFYAGIEKSKFIVSINKDHGAPINKAADVIILDDYKTVMDALAKIIKK